MSWSLVIFVPFFPLLLNGSNTVSSFCLPLFFFLIFFSEILLGVLQVAKPN